MPRLSPAIDRANTILRAHGTRFRLREGHDSRWLSVYESCPGRKVKERAARGYAARDDKAVEELCNELLKLAHHEPTASLERLFNAGKPTTRTKATLPCWPEICDAVVAFQRGQGVNMNLVGPFKGQGYFRLLPQDRPASLEDVRRLALHTSESLKAQLQDPSDPLLPITTHRQGLRQKREVVSLLLRAGSGITAAVRPRRKSQGLVMPPWTCQTP